MSKFKKGTKVYENNKFSRIISVFPPHGTLGVITKRVEGNDEGGEHFKIVVNNACTFFTIYETALEYVMDTKSTTYRFPKHFCKCCYDDWKETVDKRTAQL